MARRKKAPAGADKQGAVPKREAVAPPDATALGIYQEWFDSVVSFGNVPAEEIVRRAWAAKDDPPGPVPEIEVERTIVRVEVEKTEDGEPVWMHLEQAGGAEFGATSRQELDAMRAVALSANEAGREEGRKEAAGERLKPRWNEHSRTLYLGDVVVKKFRKNLATNQIDVIEAFHHAGWVEGVPDPFGDPQKLGETLRDLNRRLTPGTIRFWRDGTGEGMTWEYRI
jgi:hypothetical protein